MTYTEDSTRRAAVLLTCLDPADAHMLLERLGSVTAGYVREAIANLGPVTAPERERVMRAFLQRRHSVADHQQGVEIDDDLARRLATREAPSASARNQSPGDDDQAESPFAFLMETEPEVVAPFLARENPQTIAVVLSLLQRRQAAELLKRFDSDLQRHVLSRLATLDNVDPASIDVVAAELRTWLARQQQRPAAVGEAELVRDWLASGHDDDRRHLITELKQASQAHQPVPTVPQTDPIGAHPQRKQKSLAFEELTHVTDEDLRRVIQAAPQEVLMLALAGAGEELADRVVNILPRREARRLRRGVHLQGPIHLADIEDAQQRIALVAARVLAERGSALEFANSQNTAGPLAAHWA